MALWTFAASLVAFAAMPVRGLAGEDSKVENTVCLDIQITGLGKQGAKVEIKPAHPSCQFQPVEKTITKAQSAGIVKLKPLTINAVSTGADRDCSFEIVVTEPGQSPKVFRRGLQLTPVSPGERPTMRVLKCHLPATALAIKEDSRTSKTRR